MALTGKLCRPSRLVSGGVSGLGNGLAGRRARRVGFRILSEMEMEVGGGRGGTRKEAAAVRAVAMRKESAAVAEDAVDGGAGEMGFELRKLCCAVLNVGLKWRWWKINVQMFIEKGIMDCRFFTLLAVGGSVLGSVLCFLEGCVAIVQSYVQYFHNMVHRSDQGHVIELLIEAIGMFLVGTAMLMFGMGLYAMFVGSKHVKEGALHLPRSNLFGLFRFRVSSSLTEEEAQSFTFLFTP
uniref:Uncharacterized protein n=1 Tax=Kalanchoe fedtschenkoi TaxID=63787 RepID=A0A7N0TBI8_KALFE